MINLTKMRTSTIEMIDWIVNIIWTPLSGLFFCYKHRISGHYVAQMKTPNLHPIYTFVQYIKTINF